MAAPKPTLFPRATKGDITFEYQADKFSYESVGDAFLLGCITGFIMGAGIIILFGALL